MKEINTHQVLETKIRIYESWFLKELSDYFEKHKKDYQTKNDFYVSLIRVGLETEKLEMKILLIITENCKAFRIN